MRHGKERFTSGPAAIYCEPASGRRGGVPRQTFLCHRNSYTNRGVAVSLRVKGRNVSYEQIQAARSIASQ